VGSASVPLLVLTYIGAAALANVSAAVFGPVATPFNALLLVGLDLSCRDALHDAWGGRGLVWRMAGLVAVGGLVSGLVLPGARAVAVASAISFVAAGCVDAAVYHALRRRTARFRVNGSNVVASAVDSVLFPTLAFGAWMPLVVVGQWAAKVCGGYVWSLVLFRSGRNGGRAMSRSTGSGSASS